MMMMVMLLLMVIVMMVRMAAAVQIFHIVVMIFIFFFQKNLKITGVDPTFADSGNPNLKPIHRKAFQRFLQYLLVCAQIQERRHGHIPADAGFALQI